MNKRKIAYIISFIITVFAGSIFLINPIFTIEDEMPETIILNLGERFHNDKHEIFLIYGGVNNLIINPPKKTLFGTLIIILPGDFSGNQHVTYINFCHGQTIYISQFKYEIEFLTIDYVELTKIN